MRTLRLPLRHYRAYPQDRFLGHAVEDVDIDLDTSAFLVVDVYGLGLSPEDGEPYPRTALTAVTVEQEREVTVGRIKPALDAARSVALPVVYLSNSAPRIALDRSEFCRQIRRAFDVDLTVACAEDNVDPRQYHRGSSSFLKHSKIIEPRPEDYFIRKLYYSGFRDTHLDALLRDLGVRTLIVVGYSVDVCLHGTLLDALYLNYQVILLRDCTLADVERLPGQPEGGVGFTEWMILWTEMNVGRTATSEQFVRACAAVPAGQR
jgi:nicotinamidase-related amidase